MGSHSYLVNLQTNIGDLNTSGLLNSHASRYTTTNVGHMHGDRTSVISLGELQELTSIFRHDHYTKAQAAERLADHVKWHAHDVANIAANDNLDQATKDRLYHNLDIQEAEYKAMIEKYTDADL